MLHGTVLTYSFCCAFLTVLVIFPPEIFQSCFGLALCSFAAQKTFARTKISPTYRHTENRAAHHAFMPPPRSMSVTCTGRSSRDLPVHALYLGTCKSGLLRRQRAILRLVDALIVMDSRQDIPAGNIALQAI